MKCMHLNVVTKRRVALPTLSLRCAQRLERTARRGMTAALEVNERGGRPHRPDQLEQDVAAGADVKEAASRSIPGTCLDDVPAHRAEPGAAASR